MSMSVQKSKRTMHVKMITFGILLHAVASITEDSLITCDEFINDEDSVLTNISTNLSTNVTSNVSINVLNKKVRYKMGCYVLHAVLLVIISIFIVAVICYHYAKHRSKLWNILSC